MIDTITNTVYLFSRRCLIHNNDVHVPRGVPDDITSSIIQHRHWHPGRPRRTHHQPLRGRPSRENPCVSYYCTPTQQHRASPPNPLSPPPAPQSCDLVRRSYSVHTRGLNGFSPLRVWHSNNSFCESCMCLRPTTGTVCASRASALPSRVRSGNPIASFAVAGEMPPDTLRDSGACGVPAGLGVGLGTAIELGSGWDGPGGGRVAVLSEKRTYCRLGIRRQQHKA